MAKCNRCGGRAEFQGTRFVQGKVWHRYQCLCGAFEDRYVDPHGYDLDDPRAVRTIRPTPEYLRRVGL